MYTASWSATGDPRWTTVVTTGNDQVYAMTADCAGDVLVAGYAKVSSPPRPYENFFGRVSSDGTVHLATPALGAQGIAAVPGHDLAIEFAAPHLHAARISDGRLVERRRLKG